MAHYYKTTHSHPFSWNDVAGAIFQRYPNPFASHVLSEDTLQRTIIRPHVLYTKKFLTKTNKLPKWGERFFANFKKMVPLVEESFVDTEKKVITTYTRNVGLSRFMTAVERVQYSVSPDDPNVTIAVKEAWVESGLYGFRSAVKSFGIERFKKNCHRATEGLNHVLEQLASQQHYLAAIRHRKWEEVRQRGVWLKETAREKAIHAAEMAKAHSTVHAEEKSEQQQQHKQTNQEKLVS